MFSQHTNFGVARAYPLEYSIVCARQLLVASILYLPVLFALLALDKK